MDYKKSIIILIMAIFLFSITSVCASDVNDTVMAGEDTSQMILSAGNEIDVDNLKTGEENNILAQTGNEPVGAGTDSEILGEDIGNYSGLSEEIKKGRGSIELEHKYYKYDNGPTIEITESMTIEGKGAVIDMGGSNIRVFNVTASGVTINNLTIKNVNCEAEGGAFYSETGGIVTNCNFINNSAGFTGGAISFKNVTGSVANCNFIENSAAQGSAVCFWDVAGNVTNCTFTDNSAASAGALYLCGGIVSGCTFTGNSNFGRGGAIASFTNVANIVNCTFTNNYGAQGGAIAFYDADCNVTGCTFIGNTAIIGTDGGAIWTGGGNVTNCTFVNNTAESAGGAISFYDYCIVTDCTFLNNDASGYGGAISLNDGIVTNCNFINNSGEIWGGAIGSGYVSVNNCTFTGNTISGDVKNMGGHAIYSNGGGSVTNCVFVDNSAESIKYAIYSAGALYDSLDNNWWGSNDPDWDELISYDQIPSSYAVLDVTAEPDEIRAGGKSDIITKFIWNGTDTDATNLLPKRYIILSSEGNLTQTEGDVGLTSAFYANDEDKYVVNAEVDNEKLKVKVKVTGLASPTNITVNVTSLNLTVGETGSINATLTPADAGNLTYTSSNSSIAVVENGKIKAIAAGTAVVTVSFPGSGNYSAAENKTIEVTVTLKDASVSAENMHLFIGDNATVSYSTNPSNLNVTFVIDDSGVYTVNEKGFVTALKNGTGSILVKVGGDGVFAENSTTVTVTVSKVPTEITVDTASLDLKIDEEAVINANLTPADAGNLTYTSSNSSIAVVENGKIKGLKSGDAVITVSFAGNDKYAAAENKTVTLTVNLNDASVSVNNSTLDLFVDDTFDLIASTVPAGLNVNYVPDNSGVVSVDKNGKVTALKEGNATIVVEVGGDGVYAENSTTVAVSVSKVPTEININGPTGEMAVNAMVPVSAELSPSVAGNLTYVSNDTGVATVSSTGIIKANNAGTALITVSFAGNDKYAAAENKTVRITVNLNDASVSVNNSTLDLFVDDTFTIVPTTTPDGLNVTYVVDNSGVVSVDKNGKVTALKNGTASIVVEVGGDGVYAENSTTVAVSVSKVPTEINISSPIGEMSAGAMGHVAAELSPSEAGSLTYVSNDTSVATVSSSGVIMANKAGTALITVSFAGNDKYAASENKTIVLTVNLNDASVSVNNSTLDLTVNDTFDLVAATNPDGLNVTYVPDNSGVVSVDENGKVTALKTGKAVITVKIAPNGEYVENSTTVTVNVKGIPTEIASSAVTTVYNVNKNLVITLTDVNGTPLSGFNITVDLNGKKTYTTGENGQVTVSTKGLAPKAYTAKIAFNGDSIYAKSTKNVKVTVKKATPKIAAKTKTFKTTTKTKNYAIVLKNNVNKAISKATVYLKVGGKTYKATTNSKGKATFKITKLSKKGTYKAAITFKGNTYYNKAVKKVTIKVKAVWKTVSKGSKDKATVKKIQKALKKNKYYRPYPVDGIYQQKTVDAVKQFQKAKGLKVTGKVDEKTAIKLKLI